MNIGETLAKARQQAGLTVTQVSAKTRIRETVIRAIEHNDFTLCGGNFYARGHIRSIAKTAGIDPEPLIREFDDTHGGAPQAISAAQAFEPETPVRLRERRTPNWSAAMAMVLMIVVIYGIVRVVNSQPPRQVHAVRPPATGAATGPAAGAATSPSPSPSSHDPVALAQRKNVTLRIKARRTSWLSVRDSHSKELFAGLLYKGDVKQWTAKKKISVLIGDGGGVSLTVNGKYLGSPGSGRVVRLSFGPGDPAGG